MGGYVSTNYKQEEELMTSVCDGDVEAVEELLERGVDVNLQDDELSCPIHVAAYLGRDTVIRVLLDHGAALEARGQLDGTPLHAAATANRAGTVALLLRAGACVNAQVAS